MVEGETALCKTVTAFELAVLTGLVTDVAACVLLAAEELVSELLVVVVDMFDSVWLIEISWSS